MSHLPRRERNRTVMNTVKYIAAGLICAAINPASAQVRLPNGAMTGPGVVKLFNIWGQDDYDGSGIVVGSAHQAPSGAYSIYIYTGNAPQNYIWGEIPLDPAIVPPTTIQNKCTASLAALFGNLTYLYDYNIADWPFPNLLEIDGNEEINGQLFVNIYVQMTQNLQPWSLYIINLNCPPVPPPGGSND
jgi:hypothetical protein